jgi:hypothetical protein
MVYIQGFRDKKGGNVLTRNRFHRVVFMVTVFMVGFLPATDGAAKQEKVLRVGEFSTATHVNAPPPGWEPMTFKNSKLQTRYRIVMEGNRKVLKAESRSSASGLIRKISIDPNEYPFIKWSWKATGIYAKGDVTRKEGDDYPARIYITFAYDPSTVSFLERAKYRAAKMVHGEYPPSGAISYIWASKAPPGRMVPNPYTKRVMMIPVESGKDRLNTWVHEERNILRDYQKAFGSEAPIISGVAVMTDSDNTGDATTAYYGDITFHK